MTCTSDDNCSENEYCLFEEEFPDDDGWCITDPETKNCLKEEEGEFEVNRNKRIECERSLIDEKKKKDKNDAVKKKREEKEAAKAAEKKAKAEAAAAAKRKAEEETRIAKERELEEIEEKRDFVRLKQILDNQGWKSENQDDNGEFTRWKNSGWGDAYTFIAKSNDYESTKKRLKSKAWIMKLLSDNLVEGVKGIVGEEKSNDIGTQQNAKEIIDKIYEDGLNEFYDLGSGGGGRRRKTRRLKKKTKNAKKSRKSKRKQSRVKRSRGKQSRVKRIRSRRRRKR